MQTRLETKFHSGFFGDPALYVVDRNSAEAILFDCGDVAPFLVRELLKVSHIFLSHCHMDHFFGFDHFLRVHMGHEKTVTILGPRETSERVEGKLRGYTWNLLYDQNIHFLVEDLDPSAGTRKRTAFSSQEMFRPSPSVVESWDPASPIFATGSIEVRTVEIDHRTPSLAYSLVQRPSANMDMNALENSPWSAGSWVGELKRRYLFDELEGSLEVPRKNGDRELAGTAELARALLRPKQAYKLAYVTDGAACEENRRRILELVRGADLLFHEACFLRRDEAAAEETKHFTADFVGGLAQEAGVKKLVPFHFSKRYLRDPQLVLEEISRFYQGEIAGRAAMRNERPALSP